ncbi:Dabb family protein [Novosphingobium pentaromativorans]|uniref:Stress-response A/B barrel domain-containing protein n=1 Tax=Novosphingobium pentaromativorans US6-1 TaxID=1088721 RepID=G6EAW4_9SPHN|nr:Dabb family protein [Novosphingobium pentaromativorans]EHJ61751.1 hypothetical protein NSU_1512 [Novosphingobium pentaromativorans US6-1]
MFKQLALVTFDASSVAQTGRRVLEELSLRTGAMRHAVRAVVHGANAGHFAWHLDYPDRDSWAASGSERLTQELARESSVANIDAIAYQPELVCLRDPALANGIHRTLLVSVDDGTPPLTEQQFLSELRAMPDYIVEIRNAATGTAAWSMGRRRWTHIWEQDFACLDHLNSAYMRHPYHWGHVDRWFDAEMPCRIVHPDLCHSASEAPGSTIASYALP